MWGVLLIIGGCSFFWEMGRSIDHLVRAGIIVIVRAENAAS